jgi:hypothetical protein
MFQEKYTGAFGHTVVADGECQAQQLTLVEGFAFCVVTGVDAAGNLSDYNIVEGRDVRTYIAQEFSAFGLAHTTAYPVNDLDQAEHLKSKLQRPVPQGIHEGMTCV